MESMLQDVRFALRSFRRAPAVALVSVTLLAIGIGLTTSVFSVVEGVVLRSLPFRNAERLVAIGQVPLKYRTPGRYGATSSESAVELVRQSALLAGVTAVAPNQSVLTRLGDPVRVEGWVVGSDFFSLLGAHPQLGRPFTTDDDQANSTTTAIVSHAFWQTRLGSDPAVLGRTLTLDDKPVVIVGVMPETFRYPTRGDLWLSRGALPSERSSPLAGAQGGYWITARLRPGIAVAQVERELDAIYARFAVTQPAFKDWGPSIEPLRDSLIGEVRKPLLVVFGAVGLVLLIACANVANLLLARAVARQREVAIRVALGASRWRVMRQLITESVLLALAGAGVGVVVAFWSVPALLSLGAREIPNVSGIAVNGTVLLGTTIGALLTGVLFGLAPALQAIRHRWADGLRDGSATSGTSSWRSRTSDALVVGQIGLTVVLLAAATLLAGSFYRLMSVPVGMDVDRVLTADLRLPDERYGSRDAKNAFARAILDRVSGLPGVRGAAVSTGIPLASGAFGTVEIAGTPDGQKPSLTVFTGASRDYFRALGIPLLRGRTLTEHDVAGNAILVNEAFVRANIPGGDPLGRRVTFYGKRSGMIVGVVGSTRAMELGKDPDGQLYYPFERYPASYVKIALRSADAGEPAALSTALRRAIRDVDPVLPIDHVSTMRGRMADSVARQRFYAVLLVVFAVAALLMAAAGLYAMMTYVVSRRTREMGVRLALGATAMNLAGLVLRRGMALAALGVALGLVGAGLTTKLLTSLLFELTPGDLRVLTAVTILLALVSLFASYLPARRAARTSPMVAMRAD